MALRLAAATGWHDPDAMLDAMTPQQWREWQIADVVEPVGVRGIELILARIGELVAGFCGASMKAADFAPWLPRSEDRQLSPAESAEAIGKHLQRLAGK
ncbi:MAG: hypothetical protein ACK48U_11600 [Planctomyces sp.]